MTAPIKEQIGEYRLMSNYTQLQNDLLETMCKTSFTTAQGKIFHATLRKTLGWGKESDRISLSQYAEITGIKQNKVSAPLRSLLERNILLKADNEISINANFSEWESSTKAGTNNLDCTKKGGSKPSTKKGGKVVLRKGEDSTKKGGKVVLRKGHTKDTNKNTTKDTNKNTTVELVFEYWKNQLNHPRAILDDKRKKFIRDALKIGFSEDELKKAISGCSKTPWNMGKNERGQVYDGLHLILRDADQIERFISANQNPPSSKNKPFHHVQELQDTSRQFTPEEIEKENEEFKGLDY